MTFVEWWKAHPKHRNELVDSIGSSMAYIRQAVYGHKQLGPKKALAIEAAIAQLTPNAPVTRADIRPDLW